MLNIVSPTQNILTLVCYHYYRLNMKTRISLYLICYMVGLLNSFDINEIYNLPSSWSDKRGSSLESTAVGNNCSNYCILHVTINGRRRGDTLMMTCL